MTKITDEMVERFIDAHDQTDDSAFKGEQRKRDIRRALEAALNPPAEARPRVRVVTKPGTYPTIWLTARDHQHDYYDVMGAELAATPVAKPEIPVTCEMTQAGLWAYHSDISGEEWRSSDRHKEAANGYRAAMAVCPHKGALTTEMTSAFLSAWFGCPKTHDVWLFHERERAAKAIRAMQSAPKGTP